ncbi:MAG TPA: type II toxin-antitoxin system VapC family toxin [Planctomycetota bacterium]|jgi:predicted nucleic acid-binding protein|nr:type II toxin-antitoxin system VapC family toxin [Planctomycetota bacterium]
MAATASTGFVLDAHAAMAFLQGEPGGQKVRACLLQAHEHNWPLHMSVINAGEVFYSLSRRDSEAKAEAALEALLRMGIRFEPVDWLIARQAAIFKAVGNISYADCFALSLALSKRKKLITGDEEFRPFAKKVSIVWI